jgi:hypothetical protein
VINHAGNGGGIVLKTLQYILLKLHVNWSSLPCSLQVYLFPIGDSQQKQTYNNLGTHCSESACDKRSVLPCRLPYAAPFASWMLAVQPRWSAPRWCWFDYSTHACEVLTLQACHKKYEKQLTCTLVELVAVSVGCISRSVAECLNLWSRLVTNYSFFSDYFSGFAYFPNLIRPRMMICGTARVHVQHIVAW